MAGIGKRPTDFVVKAKGGMVTNLVLGVLGAIVGGFLAGVLFGGDYITGINLPTIVVAFLGAVVLVVVVRALPGRSPV